MKLRQIQQTIPSLATSDGAGVRIQRSIGAQPDLRLDPFLMLDEFYSDNPDDYIAGFPPHPHRGFETVTYMLDGHMQHQDHMGNTGDLGPGDVQWMTAARGVIHSEMPQQTEGRMRGFQLWLNLPAKEKMKPAAYRDITRTQIPVVEGDGWTARVIAGEFTAAQSAVRGPAISPATDPHYFDLTIAANGSVEVPLPAGHHAFAYLYEGDAEVDNDNLALRSAAVLGDGEIVRLSAGPEGASLLLLAARPIGEPVVQYGPFVMNTREEIDQALADYRDGTLTVA